VSEEHSIGIVDAHLTQSLKSTSASVEEEAFASSVNQNAGTEAGHKRRRIARAEQDNPKPCRRLRCHSSREQ
jgi:hypothetical protein